MIVTYDRWNIFIVQATGHFQFKNAMHKRTCKWALQKKATPPGQLLITPREVVLLKNYFNP